jgi:dTDP-4-amino-4,6-dideoxygalactose transaminase
MWSYKDHGKSWEAAYEREHPEGFRWLHETFGTNWRLTEMQAAIGRIQINRMPEWHALRKRNARILTDYLSDLHALRIPLPQEHIEHAWYKFYAFVRSEYLKRDWTRERVMKKINQLGVPCTVGSCSEVYLEKAFDNTGFRPDKRLPIAKELGETSLTFLVHPTLSTNEMEKMACTIRDVILTARA